ncbi:MAG: hypothetical protein C4582_12865 [Desulfobacteraceae bacterium]|jgi:hypothetical protein|nr:MAG: hypothetical protein C4582_12865 [Desulfobacteraceae bacterium]
MSLSRAPSLGLFAGAEEKRFLQPVDNRIVPAFLLPTRDQRLLILPRYTQPDSDCLLDHAVDLVFNIRGHEVWLEFCCGRFLVKIVKFKRERFFKCIFIGELLKSLNILMKIGL